jgi:hypothetical protein
MKRQKERARQEKQREKAERKRLRRLESKNRVAEGGDSFQIDDEAGLASSPEPDVNETPS